MTARWWVAVHDCWHTSPSQRLCSSVHTHWYYWEEISSARTVTTTVSLTVSLYCKVQGNLFSQSTVPAAVSMMVVTEHYIGVKERSMPAFVYSYPPPPVIREHEWTPEYSNNKQSTTDMHESVMHPNNSRKEVAGHAQTVLSHLLELLASSEGKWTKERRKQIVTLLPYIEVA